MFKPISFHSKDIDVFIDFYNDNIHLDKVETLKLALGELDRIFEENVKIKQTSDGKKDTTK